MTGAAMTLALVNETIKKELAAVEQLFTEELGTDLTCVNNLVRHVSRFRGKMLRPTLVLLAGKVCGELTDAHSVLATVVEMVHMATLVHDDVLDEAELRRKGATINHLRGNVADNETHHDTPRAWNRKKETPPPPSSTSCPPPPQTNPGGLPPIQKNKPPTPLAGSPHFFGAANPTATARHCAREHVSRARAAL